VLENPFHLTEELRPAHRRKAERLVDLHRGDEDACPRGETDEYRFRQEPHERGAAGEREEEPDYAREEGEGRNRSQPVGRDDPVRAQKGKERAQDEESRGVRGAGYDLRAPARERGNETRHRRGRDPIGWGKARHHGVGEALGKADEGDGEAGE